MAYFKRSQPLSDQSLYYPPNTAIGAWMDNYRNNTGQVVNSSTASGIAAYSGMVSFIANMIAKACCPVYKLVDEYDGRERDEYHPADSILNFQANEGLSSFAARRQLIVDAINFGRGAWWVRKDDMGNPLDVWPIRPWEILELVEYEGLREWTIGYLVTKNGRQFEVAADDIIDIQMPDVGGGKCIGLVQQLRDLIGLAQSELKWGCLQYKQGATQKLYIKIPGWPTGDQRAEIEQQLADMGTGIEAAHTVGLLFGNAEAQAIQSQSDQMQWIESRQQSTRELATALHLPASFCNLPGAGGVYGNLKEESLSILGKCLSPWADNCESQYNWKLIKPTLRRSRFIEHDELDFIDILSQRQEARDEYSTSGISFEERRQVLNRPVKTKGTFVIGSAFQNFDKLKADDGSVQNTPAMPQNVPNGQENVQDGPQNNPNTPENMPENRLYQSNGKH